MPPSGEALLFCGLAVGFGHEMRKPFLGERSRFGAVHAVGFNAMSAKLPDCALRRVHRHNAGADLARDDDCVLWKQLRCCQFLRARKRLKVVIAAFSGLETLRQIAERVRRQTELFHGPRQLSLIRAAENQLHR